MSAFSPLSDAHVLHGVRDLASKGKIAYTNHAEERMAERGYDRSQVKECLIKGNYSESPYIPNSNGDIEYKFKLHANIDGERIEVVATLKPELRIVVITIIDPD